MTHALGREYILSDLTAHITHPGKLGHDLAHRSMVDAATDDPGETD